MNLKNLKKVHEDDHVALFRSKDGHEVRVAKKGLNDKHKKELASLPLHAAFGNKGEPIMSSADDDQTDFDKTLNDYESSGLNSNATVEGERARANLAQDRESVGNFLGGGGGWKRAQPEQDAAQEPAAPTYNDTLPPADVSSSDDAPTDPAAAQASAPAPSPAGQAAPQPTESVPDSEAGPQQQGQMPYQQQAGIEASNYYNDLRNGHIKPETYGDLFAKKSTLGKIGTIFGLLLSGMGSGMAHQPNALLAMMNQEIDRDLDAQKQNKSNALSFYNLSNQHEYQKAQIKRLEMENKLTPAQIANLKAETELKGTQAAKERMTLSLISNLEDTGNGLPPGDNQSKWNAGVGVLKNAAGAQMAQERNQVAAQLQTPENAFKNKVAKYHRAGLLLPAAEQMAKTMEERHYTGMGPGEQTNRPVEKSDRDALEHLSNLDKSYMDAQDYLKKAGAVGARLPSGFRAQGQALQNRMELEIGQLEGLGRFTPEEAKRYRGMIPDLTGTHFTNQDAAKVKSLQRETSQHRDTIFDSYGVKKPTSGGGGVAEGTQGTYQGKPVVFKNGKWGYR